MRYPMLAGRLFNQPLLAQEDYGRTVAEFLRYRMEGGEEKTTELQPREPKAPTIDADGIMTIPVVGGLMHRGDDFDAECGMQSYTNLNNVLAGALKEERVKGILLDLDSPGGEAGGCFSFADSIKVARKKKPIWAIANSSAYSAAYAIGSACEKFYAARDAAVGSIGVLWLHIDRSEMMKQIGIVATYLFAGDHKADGNPFQPLGEAARAEIQRVINQRYDQFIGLVAENRPMTAEQARATQARCYVAEEAKELGLIDGVKSFEETRQELISKVKPPTTFVRVIEGRPVSWQK